MEHKDYEVLGNILNSTWGVGSTNNPRGATQSIKGKMMDTDCLCLDYSRVVNFGAVHERTREMARVSMDAGEVLNACIRKIKQDFKDATGRTLKVKNVSDTEDYQLLNLAQYSGRRDELYKRKLVIEVS